MRIARETLSCEWKRGGDRVKTTMSVGTPRWPCSAVVGKGVLQTRICLDGGRVDLKMFFDIFEYRRLARTIARFELNDGFEHAVLAFEVNNGHK